jgi:pimeloyl-ACP methyl ester carboxylesterase
MGRSFVLVHGAWHGGWCYARVAEILRARGHRVFSPTLTGLAERSHLAHAGVNCSTHIQDVVNVIQSEQLNEVILCGHSYGGMVVGGVADAIPNRIASLVYLDAAIPENGKSLFDLMRERAAEQVAFVVNATLDQGGQMVPPFPASAFNVNPADQALVDALCTPQPFATFCERLKLTGAYLSIPKKTYILATDWAGTHHHGMYARAKADKTWSTFEVPSGHDVMLDAPERLADILVRVM